MKEKMREANVNLEEQLVEADKIREDFKDIIEKYPDARSKMTEEQEKQFVEDLFSFYEKYGFYSCFLASSDLLEDYDHKEFKVIGRTPVWDGKNEGADLECLPMWEIEFNDGYISSAFPEEICNAESVIYDM